MRSASSRQVPQRITVGHTLKPTPSPRARVDRAPPQPPIQPPGLQPTCLASDSQANITAFATRSFNAETTPLQRTRCYRPGKNRPRAGVRPQLTIDISDGIKCLQLFLKETKWIKTNPKLIKWEWGTYLFTISTRVEQWFSSWDRKKGGAITSLLDL